MFGLGDGCVSIHIPRRTDLTPSYAIESLKEGLEIAKRAYPELSPKYLVCGSWMLDATLLSILPENSKIAHFSNLFEKMPIKSSGTNCMPFVFPGCTLEDVSTLPENTSLQRDIKGLMLSGRYILAAAGVITDI